MVRNQIGMRGLIALSTSGIVDGVKRAVLQYRIHASADQVAKLYAALKVLAAEPYHPQHDQIAAGFRDEIAREQELQRELSIRLINLQGL